ncbi:vesicle transport protein SEC20 [Anabrus simplex]|uniref:vesicle transport protein SEC20 n=1 Tax=Anabrus simplex TaxID=316456 RepID=UPI0035A35DC8
MNALGQITKAVDENYLIGTVRQEIVNHNLLVKALIQNIQQCPGPREVLNELNSEGRAKIAALRKHIEQLERLAKEQEKEMTKTELLKEVESHRQQLTSTLGAFRKANLLCILNIEKANKEELFDDGVEETKLRHRKRKDKEGLVKMSGDVTEQLLSISRQLAATTQRSADALDTLVTSSSNVEGAQDELQTMGSAIALSGKLLAKYGRREFTDKLLVLFAFAFFLACVFYIVQKRLF